MSLLSSELRIALLPGCAALAQGRDAPRVAEQPAGWEGALTALEAMLDAQRPGGRAHVTLSHHFLRLFLLEPPPTRLRRDEMRAWLGERLAESLGDVGEWRLVWPDVPPGRPVPVCALPAEYQDALEVRLARRRLRARHIRPWLDVAWSRRRWTLRRATGWYVLMEPGEGCALWLDRGRIRHLRQRRLDPSAGDTLPALLRREALLAGLPDEGEVWLERTGVEVDIAALGAGWRVHTLAGPLEPAQALLG